MAFVAFADAMIKESVDEELGITHPAYGFTNEESKYLTVQPRNAVKILYGIKANGQINSDMHSALYSKIYSGHMKFLIPETAARGSPAESWRGRR